MSEGFRLCVTYAITGRLAYLSHLETAEALRRIVRRARLPYAVSEGFTPHMKATFGPALPVGASGTDERFDVRLTAYAAPDEALARLQQAAPPNCMPLSCVYTDVRDPALDVSLPLSTWRARFVAGDDAQVTLAALRHAFDALTDVGYLETSKKKRGKLVVKRVLFSEKLAQAPVCATDGQYVVVTFATRQTESGALRPDLFINAALAGLEHAPVLTQLVRIKLEGEDQERPAS